VTISAEWADVLKIVVFLALCVIIGATLMVKD